MTQLTDLNQKYKKYILKDRVQTWKNISSPSKVTNLLKYKQTSGCRT